MLVESLVIIAIILAMALIFMRVGRKAYAYGILPLLILPLVRIGLSHITAFLRTFLPYSAVSINTCVIFMALIITCIIIGLAGANFKGKGSRTLYFIICGLFTLVLSMIFVLDIIKDLI